MALVDPGMKAEIEAVAYVGGLGCTLFRTAGFRQ